MAKVFRFRRIDLVQDWDTLVAFHRDVFRISHGSDREFSEQAYREILRDRLRSFPDGQMLAVAGDAVAGQVEIWIREYEGTKIGYVSLFYLAPQWRGKGLGLELVQYAERCFAARGLKEYHLRVSERNEPALRFYLRAGFVKLHAETRDGLVTWRMGKRIQRPA